MCSCAGVSLSLSISICMLSIIFSGSGVDYFSRRCYTLFIHALLVEFHINLSQCWHIFHVCCIMFSGIGFTWICQHFRSDVIFLGILVG